VGDLFPGGAETSSGGHQPILSALKVFAEFVDGLEAVERVGGILAHLSVDTADPGSVTVLC